MSDLNQIEKKLIFLQKIETNLLTAEECVNYCVAIIEILQERLTYLLKARNYRKTLIVEAEIEAQKKLLIKCMEHVKGHALANMDLKQFLDLKAKEYNYYRQLANSSSNHSNDPKSIIHSVKDLENQIRTLLFGFSYDLVFDGYGFFILYKSIPGSSLEVVEKLIKDYFKNSECCKVKSISDNRVKSLKNNIFEGQLESSIFIEFVNLIES